MSHLPRLMLACGLTMLMSLAAFNAVSQPSDAPRNVVELFTSQGCASCLPADKLLTSLAGRPDLVVLTLPIDYWDYNGWKDTFASPAFTARQKAYAEVRGDGQIYTPQAVLNGLIAVVGSNAEEIETILTRFSERSFAETAKIRLSETASSLHIDITAGKGAPASIYLFRVEPTSTVQIRRGENAGRSLTYTNVVKAMDKLGDWTGAEATFEIPKPTDTQAGYVVLLQRGDLERPGEILAAAKTSGL
ncbi:DUF1223 domain-containing protein [Beijerinckia indica]|uniref:DUF1223 domain-containing protein n=1 Tax=Beijerinckia indica subsp. indica (strain ATCC 9039 / DSM 1715 / NCIMB 8712) TaxID=395963 RepID=B2IFE0_BEII9|nr:DUF1223 domain-containing protein [Beijerinckia indica]ACB97040.1 protein of unknown function DUF1223 [Beijerinckia indica subsp. indica ATCC 9039]